MLNIYDGVLKLTNKKLYNSPYKANINEVGKVLNNFKFRSKLIFIRNLTTLQIEIIPEKEFKKIAPISKAIYDNTENKILLSQNENYNEFINHELFHSSSNKKKNKKRTGIMRSDGKKELGKHLNEGITEYLNLKSKNINKSLSGYQLELFVIEFIIFIYGEEILNYYFQNNSLQFFEYFSLDKNKIKKIDMLLTKSHICSLFQTNRLNYLYLTSILGENAYFNPKLQLNYHSNNEINEFLEKALPKIKEDNLELKTNLFNLLSKNELKKNTYIKWSIEYKKQKRKIFKEILNCLLELAYSNGYSKYQIEKFIHNSFQNKKISFKNLYYPIIDDKLNNKKITKIRIR